MAIMTQDTTTPEATAELVGWMDEIRLADLLTQAAAQVAGDLTETEILPGEDTICAVCEDALPAGAPAWKDRDGVLCAFCAETELEAAKGTNR